MRKMRQNIFAEPGRSPARGYDQRPTGNHRGSKAPRKKLRNGRRSCMEMAEAGRKLLKKALTS